MPTMSKRKYQRRSEDERIAELETRLAELQKKVDSKQRTDLRVLKEIPKLQRRLRDFAQLAMDHGRADLANSTMAFSMGLDRHLDEAGMSRNVPRKQATDEDEAED